MTDKLDIRAGDVVRLKPVTVAEVFDDGDIEAYGLFFKSDMVEEIVSRAETPQETIARLKAELAVEKEKSRTMASAFALADKRRKQLEMKLLNVYKNSHKPVLDIHRLKEDAGK